MNSLNSSNNIVVVVHRVAEDGTVESHQYEEDFVTQEVLSKTLLSNANLDFLDDFKWSYSDDKVNLTCRQPEEDSSLIIVKIGESPAESYQYGGPVNLLDRGVSSAGEPMSPFGASSVPENSFAVIKPKRESKIPNIPTMVRCQNCDTNFPTKYQYQRHQCEFNAEKVVLKADADIKDIDKGMRIKYDCVTCGKQFVSKNNLERHQTSHDSTQENVCEYCNKQFVSENRLRIHKENHCKKAGDISKFYRSDVTVWKCVKCNQVFATPASANKHADVCAEIADKLATDTISVKSEINSDCQENAEPNGSNAENKNTVCDSVQETLENGLSSNADTLSAGTSYVEKVLTELLLQCEFCNRTYSDRNLLLHHQKKHTTLVNYECVTCKETFDSYTTASKHWMTKCSDEANLFYLPKMTYCEFCDRTFKSHEILYTHKIKKKHYTPKLHVVKNENGSIDQDQNDKTSKDALLVKLIEDVLTTLNKDQDISNTEENEMSIKEDREEIVVTTSEENNVVEINNQGNVEPEKKKRGRKRKLPKQVSKNKRMALAADEGYIYQCERCTLVFSNITDLETHREKQHASNFSCEECGQVVHSAKALIIHSRAHQSLKPYVCEQCGRSYSQTSHLWQHMRFHQGIKPFACPHEGCEARYTIRPDLKDHIRKVHTRERPFKCSVCHKCFLTGSVYYQHRLIHTNDRRYGCDICDKRFFRADALNNHRRIHTDERPYPCDICGREFRQKGDRNKHVRTQHPE